MRCSGVLLPISSLPSKYGIGSFSKEAYDFVDFLVKAGQKYWQILPIVPTGYGDSPYASCSTFAGNPYFIDLDELVTEGLLDRKLLLKTDFGDSNRIDYGKLFETRFQVLKKAYLKSRCHLDEKFQSFCRDNEFWLKDYALYDAIKSVYPVSCTKWEKGLFQRNPETLEAFEREHEEEIEFCKYLQYVFDRQWRKLKKYANEKGIEIVGDLPIYVAMDSADFWANPELFEIDEEGLPTEVAGCPPDCFTEKGQLWGNPLYNWKKHEKTDYAWWEKRMKRCQDWYDVVRIDHFRGFDEFYCIPRDREDAVIGEWRPGPGIKLFKALNSKLSNLNIIAEDLGFVTDTVVELLKESGYPGMKILEFGFEPGGKSEHAPHHLPKHCVVYTGTHDNQTVTAWYEELDKETKAYADRYMNRKGRKPEPIHISMVKTAMATVADTCIIPMQDYLGLGREARMNLPATLGNNWVWRMKASDMTEELAAFMMDLTKFYDRFVGEEKEKADREKPAKNPAKKEKKQPAKNPAKK